MSESSTYVPGEYAVDPVNFTHPTERKSPPLVRIQPNRDEYLLIDPARYLSREHMEAECQKLWPRVWLWAGRESDIPEVGSWQRLQIGKESIIVVRSAPDEVSAFYNNCQHRGNALALGDFGKVRNAFVCPYHSWSYDLKGRCKRVTDRRYFQSAALCGNLDAGGICCETWGGNIFVNMDENARPLREYLGEIVELTDAYDLAGMSVVQDVIVDLNCNWKVALDAFSEAYHVHMTHPQALPILEDIQTQIDFYRYGHSRMWTSTGRPSGRIPRSTAVNDAQKYMLADAGIDPTTFEGECGDVPRAIREAKRRTDNVFGLDYSRYTDSQLTDTWTLNVCPNVQFLPHPEGCLIDWFHPHPDDPCKSSLHVMVLSPRLKPGKAPPSWMGAAPDADTSGKTRPSRRRVSSEDPDLKSILGELLWQDVRNIEGCSAGMRSRNFQNVRFSELEQRNQHQFAEMDRYLKA
jgi:phenylpropionate dioxygenase-like ring-hydroxylating dioxygenase large terminal subunit